MTDDAFESEWPSRAFLSLFTNGGEEQIFQRLSARFKSHLIAPQVSFSALIPRGQMYPTLRQILRSKDPRRIKRAANYLAKSRVDFVVFDRRGIVVVVVECNGGSHKRPRRRKGDILKARFLKHVGISLIVYGIHDHIRNEFAGRKHRFRMGRGEDDAC